MSTAYVPLDIAIAVAVFGHVLGILGGLLAVDIIVIMHGAEKL